MEEHNHSYANASNLPTLNFKSQTNLNIDSKTHIKQVINIETCLIDYSIEPMSHKAIIKGSIGIKAIYVDTDNMFNSLSDRIAFSETINNDIITTDCQINIINAQFLSEFDNDDKVLRVNIDSAIDCFCNINTNINIFNPAVDGLISKKSIMSACSCTQKINKSTNFDFGFKLDDKVNKILSYDSKIIIDECKCYDGYVLINGQILNNIIYETENNINIIKILNNSTIFKCEIEANGCDSDCMADISAYINLNSTQITTDINDNDTQLNFEYCIMTNGYIYKNTNIDIVEDVYSTQNFIEPIKNNYNLCQKSPYFKTMENVDAEITLTDELNVDEIIGMLNTSASIAQHSIKENSIIIEGVVNGNLLYLDENREIKHLTTQLPYSINIKQEFDGEVCGLNLNVVPINCKCKIKRGNTLMIDYELCVSGSVYTKNNVALIDNVKYGKVLDFGDITFQIYIAHANENAWELCKRLHITQEQLNEFNGEIPNTFLGGEKIIVYR